MAKYTSGILTKKGELELLRSQLDTERSSFITLWKECNDFVKPRRGRFTTSDVNRGDRRTQKIINATASLSLRTLSAGLQSSITSPAQPWFRLTTQDAQLAERESVKLWLHAVTELMRAVFHRSNWYHTLPTLYTDVATFGTGAMMMEEDDVDTIRCTTFPIGSYYLANDHRGRVCVFMREFRMTVRQLVEQFGGDGPEPDWPRFSVAVRTAWETKRFEQWIDVVHAITPNVEHNPNLLASKYKRFSACYYEKGGHGDQLLEEKGFDEFPVFAPRWEATGEDTYGTACPAIDAMGDVKMLMSAEKLSMQAIEKMVKPPMKGPTTLRTAKASILPGDITYVDEREGQGGFRPVHEVNPRVQELELKIEKVEARIKRAFFEDLFLMLAYADVEGSSQPVTAAEIAARKEEKLLVLGPMVQNLDQDLLNPGVDRVFNVMLRRGDLPEAPPELEGEALKVEYISIMHQAQKAVGLGAIDRVVDRALVIAGTHPEIVDKIDFDQSIDEYADLTGVTPRIIVSDERVAAIREARAKAAAAAQQAETLKTAAAGAKTLSETDTQGQNALTDILTGVGGLE